MFGVSERESRGKEKKIFTSLWTLKKKTKTIKRRQTTR